MRITCRCGSILTFVVAALPMFGADVSSNSKQIMDKELDAVEHEVTGTDASRGEPFRRRNQCRGPSRPSGGRQWRADSRFQ
jgi:hypothetical protein